VKHPGIARIALLSTVATLGATALSPARANAAPSFCTGTGPINASAITAPVDTRTCRIQGRQLLIFAGHSHFGGVNIPPAGSGITNTLLTTGGEYELTVTNTGGVVSVKTSTPATSTSAVPATDAACGEGAYNLSGHRWMSGALGVSPVLFWFYNESTVSRAGLNLAATISDIRAGNFNMSTGQNNCGFATGRFGVSGSFQGNTNLFANIDCSGNCTSRFPDTQNTLSWGPLNATTPNGDVIAQTCTDWIGAQMREADIYIGSNKNIVDSFSSSCSGQLDLQSVVTHEWGHAFGLNHETSGTAEVMYPVSRTCQLRRHLGLGDYNGMKAMYP
jgi:hypothetical protein